MSDYIPYELLPNELLVEIIAKLPVASLLRFKSVCKSWYSLITSPSFVSKHLSHCKKGLLIKVHNNDDGNVRYLFFRDNVRFGDECSELEFPYPYPYRAPFEYFRIVGSCNGLLCIWEHFSKMKPATIVWNPSIRNLVTLPHRQVAWTVVLGFGAHPSTHEYKVVRIAYQKNPYIYGFQPQVELYTQGAGSWRGLSSTFPPSCYIEYEASQAFVNGAVNWIATDLNVSVGCRPLIVSFDMRTEMFSVLMLPPDLADEKPASLSVKLFRNSLAVLCDQEMGTNSCCIWVMKEYGVPESWTKQFSFKVDPPIVLDRALGVGANGKVLLSTKDDLLRSKGDNRLLLYDSLTKALTDTEIRGCSHKFRVEAFMETLVSVNQGCVLDGQLNHLECCGSNSQKRLEYCQKNNINKQGLF